MTERDFKLTEEQVEHMHEFLMERVGKEVGVLLIVLDGEDSKYHSNITADGIVTVCRDVALQAVINDVLADADGVVLPVHIHEVVGDH